MKQTLPYLLCAALFACGSPDAEPVAEPEAGSSIGPTVPADSNAHRLGGLILKLMGDWTDATTEPGAIVHERWSRTDDAFYSGLGFVMVDKDTVFIEHLHLAGDSSGRIAYNVRVPSQNEGDAVSFALTLCAGDSMVFENPAHDFPQRIAYALQADGDWIARVSGPGKDGKLRVLRYRFKRVKP
ncbi:MAG TPA: DUF6265 family protein [Flavobacteriales bacterium]|nr:DUF6265 family protein [Flavobacteriales bacterium]